MAAEIESTDADSISAAIRIHYKVTDTEKNNTSITFFYSPDNGLTWKRGAPDRDLSHIPMSGYEGSFGWAYGDALQKGIDYTGIRVRVTVSDYVPGNTAEYGPLHVDLNDPPSVTLTDLFSTQSGDVPIRYRITDAESDTVRFACSYSTNDGASWHIATDVGGAQGITSPDGEIVWHSRVDLPSIQSFTVRLGRSPGITIRVRATIPDRSSSSTTLLRP